MTRLLKDSGIPWINQIPQNREVKKVKYTLLSRNENNNPIRSRDILSLTAKQGVIPLDEKEGGGNKPKEDYSAYKLAYPGDIVINSMNILSGSVGLSNYFGCVSPVYYMLRPSKANDDVRFFNYIFQTKVFQLSLLGLGNGILIKESDSGKFNTIRMRIPLDKFGNLYIPIPSSEEQKKISNYLDKKIGEIDSLYADIEKQIEKLEEYKLSVITETVSRGLNPNVEMKEEKNKWYGYVPKQWDILKSLYVLSQPITDGPHTTPELFDEGIPFVSAEAVSCGKGGIDFDHIRGYISQEFYEECCKKYTPKIDDIYLIKSGATTGKVSIVKTDKIFTIWSPLAVFRCDTKKMLPKYLFYCLQSTPFQNQIQDGWTYGTQQNIGMRTLEHLKVSKPPLDEQNEIIKYLDNKCGSINDIISKKENQLDILDQYKKSLIYEYVTGKKEVPSNY